MDIASLIGIATGFLLMVVGIIINGGVSALVSFLDAPSALITFGGAFMIVFASCSIEEYVSGLKAASIVLKQPVNDTGGAIRKIIELSNVARKEGLLALEEQARAMDDAFMQKGLLLIVDGTEPELVKSVLEADLDSTDARHKSRIQVWEDLAGQGPAWGMIGTLIGLVVMLNNMADPSSIGPAMAVALLTTMYGSILANWLCFPMSTKLKKRNDAEYTLKSIVIEGLLSIQAGENPRVTEEKLKSFLAPAERSAYEAESPSSGGGGE